MGRALFLVVVIVAACGPGLAKTHDEKPRERGDSLVAAAGNPNAFRKLLRNRVVYGGLWFQDAECVRQFPAPGPILEPRLDAFAKCLAGLSLQPTAREDAFIDAAVMAYAPGFEVEALVLAEESPRLVWIGYAGRRDARDALPAITPEVLESLRTAGDRMGPVDAAAASELTEAVGSEHASAYAWLKVCIDGDGAVTSVHPRLATSTAAVRVFTAAASAWHFRPFVVAGQAIPVCSTIRMTYPPTHASSVETLPPPSDEDEPRIMLPPNAIEAKRIAGNKLIVPSDRIRIAIQKSGITRVVGSFKLCIDVTGHVESVKAIRPTGITSYDEKIMSEIRRWTYSPFTSDGTAQSVCTAVTFVYTQH